MKIILKEGYYGYCPGLNRSLRIADNLIKRAKKEGKEIYYDVPLAHNTDTMKTLDKKGLKKIILNVNLSGKGNYFLISAHGASTRKVEWLKKHGFEVILATCGIVEQLKKKAIKDYEDGYQIVIFGKADHAEIIGVNDSIDNSAKIVRDVEGSLELNLDKKTSLLCQTTYSSEDFLECVTIIKNNNPKLEIKSHNTYCPIVKKRVEEILKMTLDGSVDLAIVVGSKASSNTKLLANKLSKIKKTMMVENESEIIDDIFGGVNTVLVVSGTSASPEVVLKVAKKLQKLQVQLSI